MMTYWWLATAWAIYLILHSWLASERVKTWVPISARGYRLLYSALSSAGILVLFYWMATIPPGYLFASQGWLQYGGLVLTAWGVMTVMAAFRQISARTFLGLKAEVPGELIRSGVYAKVRHPIYSGTLLILAGMVLFIPTLAVGLSVLVVVLYLPVGIYFEEQKLILQHGESYLQYRREVKAVVPGVV